MAKILIVDDSVLMRNLLKDELIKAGHEIIGETGDGNEALKLVNILLPEIVFLDIILPGIVGLEVLKIIKEKYPSINVIVNSVLENLSIQQEVIQSGAKAYILKPFSYSTIHQALAKV